jgi:hypothetical protein
MGRPVGYHPSAEQIAAMQEGRRRAREDKIAAGIPVRKSKHDAIAPVATDGKPILYITNRERDACDFYTSLRDTFRPLHLYSMLDKILREITDRDYWKNTGWIKNKLDKYVIMMERS